VYESKTKQRKDKVMNTNKLKEWIAQETKMLNEMYHDEKESGEYAFNEKTRLFLSGQASMLQKVLNVLNYGEVK